MERATREQFMEWLGGNEDGRQIEYLVDICMEKVNASCECCNFSQDVISLYNIVQEINCEESD